LGRFTCTSSTVAVAVAVAVAVTAAVTAAVSAVSSAAVAKYKFDPPQRERRSS
jgi:hypothetical protein